MSSCYRLALAGALVLTLGAGSARADFGFDLVTGNNGSPGISGYTGPYAHVNVHLTDSQDATVTFTSLTNSGNIYLMGDGGSVAVNVNASSWTLGTITGSNAGTGFNPGQPYSDGGAGNEDGFGSFNQTINSFDGFGHSSDTISFTLTNTGGTWSDASTVLTGNSDGHSAAAHIFVTTSPANASNTALATGYATDGPTVSPLPEPGPFLGAGVVTLIGLGYTWRRRRRAAA
jgi:hypothetical protein